MTPTDIDALWDYRDPAESERRFRGLLPRDGDAVDAPWLAELRSQWARAVCLQRRYDEAYAILDGTEGLLAGGPPRPRIRCLLERGRIHNDTGRAEEALALFREAWTLADGAGEILLAADALHMLACVSRGEENLRWHRAAIEFCRRHDLPRLRRWEVTLHTNMADEYERQGDFTAGIGAVERSLALAGELGLAEAARGASVFLARLHRLNGDVHRALEILRSVFDPADPRGWAHEELAESLRASGRVEESRPHFRRAFALLSKDPWFPPGEAERLERLGRLGGEG